MPHRILIMGLDTLLQARLQSHLVAAGYAIAFAEDAIGGLALQQSRPFDLVILELTRPSLDGLEFLAGLRACPRPSRPAVIVLADVPPAEALVMAAGLDVASCLSQPIDFGMLLTLVSDAFRPERRASSSTWYVEDELVEPMLVENGHEGVSTPEDPDSVTFH